MRRKNRFAEWCNLNFALEQTKTQKETLNLFLDRLGVESCFGICKEDEKGRKRKHEGRNNVKKWKPHCPVGSVVGAKPNWTQLPQDVVLQQTQRLLRNFQVRQRVREREREREEAREKALKDQIQVVFLFICFLFLACVFFPKFNKRHWFCEKEFYLGLVYCAWITFCCRLCCCGWFTQ